jgi:hypothetical protein
VFSRPRISKSARAGAYRWAEASTATEFSMSFLKLFGLGNKKPENLQPSGNRKVYVPAHGVKKSDSKRSNKFGPKKD